MNPLKYILKTNNVGHDLYYYPSSDTRPYFFKNNHLSNIVLLQNTKDINKSISVSTVWEEQNYNSHDKDISILEDRPYYLHTISRKGVMKTYQVGEYEDVEDRPKSHILVSGVDKKNDFSSILYL
jgi:hypothetical protein